MDRALGYGRVARPKEGFERDLRERLLHEFHGSPGERVSEPCGALLHEGQRVGQRVAASLAYASIAEGSRPDSWAFVLELAEDPPAPPWEDATASGPQAVS